MIQESLAEAKGRMQKAVEALRHDLATIRTGRASAGLVENLKVDYYGVPTPLKQMATITIPEARLIVIQPWDRTAIASVEKAILRSELGITPSNDGSTIRLVLPQLTEERRQELARLVRKRVEESRVAVRNVRRDVHEELRHRQREHQISEDELRRAEQELQKLTDSIIAQVDKVGEEKEAELLAV
jgi:ribosome recycling factor